MRSGPFRLLTEGAHFMEKIALSVMRSVISGAHVSGNDGFKIDSVVCGRRCSARLSPRRFFDSLSGPERIRVPGRFKVSFAFSMPILPQNEQNFKSVLGRPWGVYSMGGGMIWRI